MAKYKAYPEYKDSGVEWLGEIPIHWEMLRHKYVAFFTKGKNPTNLLEQPLKNTLPYLSMECLRNNTTDKYALISNDVRIALEGQPLIIWDGSNAGEFVKGKSGILSSTMAAATLTYPLHPQYYWYVCISIEPEMRKNAVGMGIPHVNGDELKSISFGIPSFCEQKQIAVFLDHETAKIDNLIEKQQQLIELLKEKRQAVISHAVTKGLNPDVPMKDSGVEWLGEVPEHWGITKLKWVGRTTSGGTPTTSKFEIYYEDGHIPWIRTTDLNNGELFDTPIKITLKAVNDTACSILPVGSVLLGMYGGAGSIGKHAILRFESTINQAVCGVLPCRRILPDFLHKYYEFYRPFWMVDAAGTRKDPNIGQDNIKEGTILIPPFEEQVEINNHIDNMRNIYECIIENALEGVDLLQERRTALISAAVTGKIDVRDWVAPDTQDIEASQEATA
ncbi:restriction endonuclease subunit S [Klebsiella variicola]|uniref:Restriction endonuclease subunit S n=1 Tax=Klebsiella variicola TaxID=244366 RepID=A0A7H0EKG0_KLEVA|nr:MULTISPECIES: restriction endonuclease subunit S [Klebsiella]MCC5456686.1 restriction endonuclease subunit S [Klebsiella variicola]MCQ0525642.1 restriction endonuclease subunit S [Klebsiella pneumoniae]MCZ3531661.1 restriction endonuclease subunit S [Klebsiella variicola]QNP24276.1 restriction endonuclease subunit S [Klebsiella variicola]HCB0076958.1 restriction endonuclease subunit S [Klebsiella variicola subsp. variicola]